MSQTRDVLLSIEIDREPGALVIRLSGDLDVTSSALLDFPRPLAFEAANKLIVDLSELKSCDLAGLRRLAQLHESLTAGGMVVRMTGAPPSLLELARLSGVPSRFLTPVVPQRTPSAAE